MTDTPPPERNEPASQPPPRIELVGLTKRFRSGADTITVLDHADLTVAAGSSIAILGPSGSGKSTLLGLIAGLDRPDAGEVRIDGESISGWSEDRLALYRRRRIGFVFQTFELLGHLTAFENALLPLELTGAERPAERAARLLEMVGLEDRGHHYPSQLSGGEQQRVAVARAFAARPAILLADEPTGNLDPKTGGRVLSVLADLRRRFGTTLVVVTHDRAVAALADRRLTLDGGRLVGESP